MTRRRLLLTVFAVLLTITGSALVANVVKSEQAPTATTVTADPGAIRAEAALEDVTTDLDLIGQGEMVVITRQCLLCFGLQCAGQAPGFVCNPITPCQCKTCGGQFNCFR